VRTYRKSGNWRHTHANSALVKNGRYTYNAVVLIGSPEGGRWPTRLTAH